jgi:integrase
MTKNNTRWTVNQMKKYGDFCGFDLLKSMINEFEVGMQGFYNNSKVIRDMNELEEFRALTATAFETGARIGEVIGKGWANSENNDISERKIEGLMSDNFTVTADEIVVKFQIEKRYKTKEKVTKYKATDDSEMRWDSEEKAEKSDHPYEPYSGWKTEQEYDVRKIAIPINEPLNDIMLDWVDRVDGRLFNRREEKFNSYYNRFYRALKEVHRRAVMDQGYSDSAPPGEFPPHRLRAEKATMMATRYKLRDNQIDEWFAWESGQSSVYTTLQAVTFEEMSEAAKKIW